MARVVHVEVQADEVDRAKVLYERIFGWMFQDDSSMSRSTYWGITTGPDAEPGINGGLLERPNGAPGPRQGTNAYLCTVGVGHDDDVERRVLEAGGQVALPKFALAGMAWQGYYLDTEGNTFGIHQPDPDAA